MKDWTLDRVSDFWVLRAAAHKAARGTAGTAGTAAFMAELESGVLALQRELRGGVYAPRPLRRFRIRDPKPRWIAAADFRDRVVHHALCAVLEPLFEDRADPDSYACRKGRGTHAALRRLGILTARYGWYYKLDILHCFEGFDLADLHADLCCDVTDPALRRLLWTVLEAGQDRPGKGLPIGNLTSQHLANHRLGVLDRAARSLGVSGYVRYMDDMVLFGDDAASLELQARALVGVIEGVLRQREKVSARRHGPTHAGVPALGFRIWPRAMRLDGARRRRFLARVRAVGQQLQAGTMSEDQATQRLGSSIAWVAHGDTLGLRRSALRG